MKSRRKRYGLLLCLGLGLAMGCDRNIAPYDPAEVPQEPDLRRIFPAPEPTQAMPPMGMGSGASSPAAGQGGASPSAGAVVRGQVDLMEGLQPAPGAVLFVIARKQGVQAGPPLAVTRIGDPRFPQVFELGQDQVMIPGLRFEGPISLTARLDSDGNAMTRDPADPATATGLAAQPGQLDVLLMLEAPGSR